MKNLESQDSSAGRAWFILAAAAYGVWLGFLAVLAVIRKVR
jgi:hypothetical protein